MRLIAIFTCLALTGCATDKAYYDAIDARTRAEQTIAVAKAEADKARYAAIASMANNGGDAAKVAAMFSLMQQAPASTAAHPSQPIAPAPTPIDRVLQVLQVTNSIVTPWIGPVMAYKQGQTNGQVAIAQAQASRDVSLGSYNAIAQVAANIPQPTTTTTTTTNTTTTTANQTTTNSVGRDGVIGAGTLTRTCTAGAGGVGAAGAAGGYAALSPALAASGVPGNSSSIGGAGGAGAPGGAGGALNC